MLCRACRGAEDTIPQDVYEAWWRERDRVGFHQHKSLSVLAGWEEQWMASPWMQQ